MIDVARLPIPRLFRELRSVRCYGSLKHGRDSSGSFSNIRVFESYISTGSPYARKRGKEDEHGEGGQASICLQSRLLQRSRRRRRPPTTVLPSRKISRENSPPSKKPANSYWPGLIGLLLLADWTRRYGISWSVIGWIKRRVNVTCKLVVDPDDATSFRKSLRAKVVKNWPVFLLALGFMRQSLF